ncbi:hypothetical protein [Hymenobacter gummosus]|uniref:hypothetical protein n=1 Tax=Hymenobacter gummosus TaxID=1776032 RepID=UPI0014054C45|nr:hypothetical protein [Hymenobacter gummosus]
MRIASLRVGLGLLLLGTSLAFTACETPEVGPKAGGKGGCGTPSAPTTTTSTGGAS